MYTVSTTSDISQTLVKHCQIFIGKNIPKKVRLHAVIFIFDVT